MDGVGLLVLGEQDIEGRLVEGGKAEFEPLCLPSVPGFRGRGSLTRLEIRPSSPTDRYCDKMLLVNQSSIQNHIGIDSFLS